MTITPVLALDYLQDDFVRAVMYAFAIAGYEGQNSVSLNAVTNSEIFVNLPSTVIDEALRTAQRSELVTWDENRVEAISLTSLGLAKFRLVRDDFFDEDRNVQLRQNLAALDQDHLWQSQVYQSIKQECNGLGALPGQNCPATGTWFARRLSNSFRIMQEGETFPINPIDRNGDRIIWYLKSSPHC